MSEIRDSYWRAHFGATDEAAALVAHLSGLEADTVEVQRLFSDLGLAGLSGNYTDTELDGYGDAFLVVAALAVLIAESRTRGTVDLGDFGATGNREIGVHVDSRENTQINTALKYFALSPEDHAAAERFDEDELSELADLSEGLRGQLD